jgi:tetratricopeptide (TPR) repeat protein
LELESVQLTTRQQLQLGAALLFSILLSLWCYWPGLDGVFLVDDRNNLIAMNSQGGVSSWETLRAFVFGGHAGALGRPVSMLSFLVNDQAFPGDISRFRFTNLMIHCLCGIALFVFSRLFLRSLGQDERAATVIAVLTSSWWLLSPLNVSTTLYVVQRMTQLSALFVLLGLIFYLQGRERLIKQQLRGWMLLIIGLFGFGGLAVLSKENGALIFVYAMVCELTIVAASGQRSLRPLILLLSLPLIALLAYFLLTGTDIVGRYRYRDFTLGERLLTEASMLWDYLLKALLPVVGKFGLVHDDFQRSDSLFSPWYTSIALFAHLLLIAGAWLNRQRWPLLFFAVGWFYGGHLLESTFIPLELYYEHRNYLPIAGVYMALVVLLWNLRPQRLFGRLLISASIITAAFFTHQQAVLWGNPFLQMTTRAVEHPDSVRAQTDFVGALLSMGEFRQAQGQLESMRKQWPEYLHIDLLLLQHQCLGNFNSYYTLQDTLDKQHAAVFSGNLPAASRGLMDAYRPRSCQTLDDRPMLSLLTGLDGLPYAKPYYNADVAYWQAEIYRNLGDLSGAIAALDRAYSYSRNSIYRYTQAVLFYSAGLNDDSLKSIKLALSAELAKPFNEQQNIRQYQTFKEQLEALETQ